MVYSISMFRTCYITRQYSILKFESLRGFIYGIQHINVYNMLHNLNLNQTIYLLEYSMFKLRFERLYSKLYVLQPGYIT